MENNLIIFSVFNILFLFSLLEIKIKKKLLSIIGIVILAFFIANRDKIIIDNDYKVHEYFYYNFFNETNSFGFVYNFFTSFCSKVLKINFMQFSFIYGVMSLFLLSKIFDEYSNRPNLCMFIYFGIGFLTKNCLNIRSGLSTIICFYSLKYILRNEKIKYIINIFISMGIHFSGILYLVIILIPYRYIKKHISKIFIFSLFISILFIFIDIGKLFLWISEFPLGRISERINIYFLGEGKVYLEKRTFGIRGITSLFGYICYYFLLRKNFIQDGKQKYYFFLILSLKTIFKLVSYKVIIISRIVEVFNIVDVFIIYSFLNVKLKKNARKLYIKVYYIVVYIYILLSVMRTTYLLES